MLGAQHPTPGGPRARTLRSTQGESQEARVFPPQAISGGMCSPGGRGILPARTGASGRGCVSGRVSPRAASGRYLLMEKILLAKFRRLLFCVVPALRLPHHRPPHGSRGHLLRGTRAVDAWPLGSRGPSPSRRQPGQGAPAQPLPSKSHIPHPGSHAPWARGVVWGRPQGQDGRGLPARLRHPPPRQH